jgi:hypothetical protein
MIFKKHLVLSSSFLMQKMANPPNRGMFLFLKELQLFNSSSLIFSPHPSINYSSVHHLLILPVFAGAVRGPV